MYTKSRTKCLAILEFARILTSSWYSNKNSLRNRMPIPQRSKVEANREIALRLSAGSLRQIGALDPTLR